MSLPSAMFFLKNGEVVERISCNIGWFFSVEKLPNFIIRSINEWNPDIQRIIDGGKPEFADKLVNWGELDIDEIQVYGYSVTYEDYKSWYHKEITDEELVERFKEVK